MLNASAAAFNFNRLSYDNYAWPGAPRPASDKSSRPLAQRYSQVFIYFVLINARNWLRLVALAGNEGRGAAGPRMKIEGRQKRDARGVCAQQPERSSRSPLSRSLGQPCNFRPLLFSSLVEAIISLPSLRSLSTYAYDFIDFCMDKYLWISLYAYFYLILHSFFFISASWIYSSSFSLRVEAQFAKFGFTFIKYSVYLY